MKFDRNFLVAGKGGKATIQVRERCIALEKSIKNSSALRVTLFSLQASIEAVIKKNQFLDIRYFLNLEINETSLFFKIKISSRIGRALRQNWFNIFHRYHYLLRCNLSIQ